MANRCCHKYKLKDLTRDPTKPPYMVYVCTKQTCSHHIRVELIEGKLAECNRCGSHFIMRLAKLKHGDRIIVKPHCDECTKTPARLAKKKEKYGNAIEQLMNSMLPRG